MAVFEIVYKTSNNSVNIENIKAIKHGFYLPYAVPFFALVVGLWQRCWFLLIWSIFITTIFLIIKSTILGITIKLALLISFTFFIPDIKKLDLAHKGYISGGYFVEKNQNKAIRKFFEKIKL